jgi:hypothetical protein
MHISPGIMRLTANKERRSTVGPPPAGPSPAGGGPVSVFPVTTVMTGGPTEATVFEKFKAKRAAAKAERNTHC